MAEKWTRHNWGQIGQSVNKRKYKVLVVGTGLAGASLPLRSQNWDIKWRASLFRYRVARIQSLLNWHQCGKELSNDGDSVSLFYDTVKGALSLAQADVHRLAEVSNQIIDHCVAQGIPFAREYGGNLANRSFGGAQVSRTFYARGQTGQQLLLGAYGALQKEIANGSVKMHTRCELIDVVVIDGRARGIITRNLVTGEIERHVGDAVVLATGGYGNVFYLSTNAMNCNASAAWRACKKGALFANPCFTQIHPTCIPVHGDYQSKLTLMSESLRNDGRIWVPKKGIIARHRSRGGTGLLFGA